MVSFSFVWFAACPFACVARVRMFVYLGCSSRARIAGGAGLDGVRRAPSSSMRGDAAVWKAQPMERIAEYTARCMISSC